jgi:peptide/nickel transport system ATP-binding protein
MQALCAEAGTALVWITHDLALVSGFADRVAVMYAGRIVEQGPVDAVLTAPLHPYTRGLIGSLPEAGRRGVPLDQIPGLPPSPLDLPPGCAFAPRCPRVDVACDVAPDTVSHQGGRTARCWHPHAALETVS